MCPSSNMSFLILKQLYRFSTNLRRHIYLECLHNFCKESFVCGHCAGSLYICIYVLVLKNVLRNSHIQYTPILVYPLILYGDFVGVHLGLWRVLILHLRLLLNCYSGPTWPAIDHTKLHCSEKGPYFRDQVPIGTFLTFWVPIGSLFIFQGPYFQCFG